LDKWFIWLSVTACNVNVISVDGIGRSLRMRCSRPCDRVAQNAMLCANSTKGALAAENLQIGGTARGCYGDLTGVSATRRSVARPALVTISRSLASPACAPGAAPVSCDRELSCPSATILACPLGFPS
jgi:hypothetical protein